MTSIQQIIEEFKSSYESNTDKVSLSEMKKKLTEIYKKHTGSSEKKEKKKREPTFYNLFMREKMAELKEDKEMSGKDKMKKIAEMWGEQNKK